MNDLFTLCAFADEADSSLEGQVSALKDNNIKLLEIRGVDGKNIADITVKQAKEIKKRLDDAGVNVWSIGSPIGKIDINQPFSPHLEVFCRLLQIAHVLGAKHFRLFSFYGANQGSQDSVLEKLRLMDQAAAGSGVVLCHENEKGIFGDVVQRCLIIHQNLCNIKAVFDPANFVQCDQNTIEAWQSLKPYVEYLHIKDAMADGSIVPAGHGIGNIKEILNDLVASEKSCVLTLEPHLHVFEGLSALEDPSDASQVGKYSYPSSRKAFDVAVESLTSLIPTPHTL